MTKTITVNGRTFTIAPMTFGEGRDIFKPGADPFEANCQMAAACLTHGGQAGTAWTVDSVKQLPFPVGQALVLACLEINGLRETTTGEASAGGDARATAGETPALPKTAA